MVLWKRSTVVTLVLALSVHFTPNIALAADPVTEPYLRQLQDGTGSFSNPVEINTTTSTTTTTTTGTCGTCQGLSCDRQTESNGATCEYMERELNCDCSWCECPTDCFDVYDLEKGNGTCAYYAENDFCNSYFCEDCIYAGLCDYSCHFGNCDTTTTTTTTTTDIDTTTQFVSTTRALYFENIYPNTKTTCNNIYKIEAVCTGTSPCSLRECWVCSGLFPGPVASCSLWLLIHYLGILRR